MSRLDPPLVANTLHGERSRRGDGCGPFEREGRRLPLEPRLRNGGVFVFGERATVAPEVGDEGLSEHFIARLEAPHVLADPFDDSRQIRTRHDVLRPPHSGAHEAHDVRQAPHHVPDVGVDRRRMHTDKQLVVRSDGLGDLAELQDSGDP
jgi:hypothetical protein